MSSKVWLSRQHRLRYPLLHPAAVWARCCDLKCNRGPDNYLLQLGTGGGEAAATAMEAEGTVPVYIVSGSRDKHVKLWDVATRQCIHTFVSKEYPPQPSTSDC